MKTLEARIESLAQALVAAKGGPTREPSASRRSPANPRYDPGSRPLLQDRLAGAAVVVSRNRVDCASVRDVPDDETIERLLHPEELSHLWMLAGAGLIGFVGNELAARIRLHAGERLSSPALVADGKHARVDGFVSLGVIASAALVGLGLEEGDPIVGLLITFVILKVTWDAWRTVRAR